MIGNNACGTRALGYGRTSDNVLGLRGLTGTGESLDATGASRPTAAPGCRGAGLATIRTEFGRFGRQVSGYALENLLPEKGFDIARLLVGSEGTLAVATEATVRLVAEPAYRVLVVLGYPDIAAAGDATPQVLTHHPVACEGIDSRIVDVVRERLGPQAVPPLPRGAAWLFVEMTGDDPGDTVARAEALGRDCGAVESWWSPTPASPPHCGGSGPTAPGCPVVARQGCPPTPAGRTPPCHRPGWVPTCATSTP